MKFTHLRLTGFKSFVDRTDVPIEQGLTGIVGPNGCGKSNLVEAMRWVMGEGSYKSLRASSMDDVIFSGSTRRPARNTAEVALVVDNAERLAPVALNDDENLEICRRIERESGSTYRINGREVRARDVQLLFADAATGAHSPALVRQGQIGELIGAKPQARRRILEDAAGIGGLHSRRHEAELRLKAADANLLRLDDILAEIVQQRDQLNKQARQARRYREMSAEIARLEALVLYLKWHAAEAGVTALDGDRRAATQAVAAATEEASRLARLREEASEVLPDLREADAGAGAALRRLIAERDALANREVQVRDRLAELGRRLGEIADDRKREDAAIVSTDAELDRIAGEIATLERAIADGQSGDEALRAAVAMAEDQLKAVEADHATATRAAADIAARRRQAEKRVAEQASLLTRLDGQRADIQAETERLSGATDRAAEIAALAEAVTVAETALAEAERAATAAEGVREAARARETASQGPMREAEQALKELETEHRTLQRLLTRTATDLFPPLIDQVTVMPGFEVALGAALGDELDYPCDEGAPVHWALIAPDEDPALPAGVRALSDVVEAPDVLRRRLGQIGLIEAADGARLHGALRPGQRLVTRDGDLWRWDGFVARAGSGTAAAERLAQQNRIADLEQAMAAARGAVERCREGSAAAAEAARQAVAAEQEARRRAKDAVRALQAAQTAHAAAERKHSADLARLSALAEAEARLTQNLEEAAAAKADAEATLVGLGTENGAEAEIARLAQALAERRAEVAEARAKAESARREQDLTRQQIGALTKERERWAQRKAEALAQVNRLSARADDLATEKTDLEAEPARIAEARGALADRIDAARQSAADAADALARGETALKTADQAAHAAEQVLAQARETRAGLEARHAAQRDRVTELVDAIAETLGDTPEEARRRAGFDAGADLPKLSTIEPKLDRLKGDRERLGAVNLRAEQERDEIEERFQSLTAEREDLDKAVRKLRHAISSLNAEGRERLLDAFAKVNEHFQYLFAKLFEGGQAELRLTESDDPLEAGLEILARPPGKKPQTLTLLSGGEQALTAIALIFAVFLTNPAPICVLDEVDAPLDDANVTRYCALMDEMARITDTRYLIITHNPITMSRMDRLFGVTMAERGVSQIVSVDLVAAAALKAAE